MSSHRETPEGAEREVGEAAPRPDSREDVAGASGAGDPISETREPTAPGRSGSRRGRRGPRRATGGTTISQGEPERLAGLDRPGGWSASREEAADAEADARGRWILEQRPPHWG